MRQTTIWDFLPQESSIEAQPTNQRNIMNFKSLEDVLRARYGKEIEEVWHVTLSDVSMKFPRIPFVEAKRILKPNGHFLFTDFSLNFLLESNNVFNNIVCEPNCIKHYFFRNFFGTSFYHKDSIFGSGHA